jgi:hypothetical protein
MRGWSLVDSFSTVGVGDESLQLKVTGDDSEFAVEFVSSRAVRANMRTPKSDFSSVSISDNVGERDFRDDCMDVDVTVEGYGESCFPRGAEEKTGASSTKDMVSRFSLCHSSLVSSPPHQSARWSPKSIHRLVAGRARPVRLDSEIMGGTQRTRGGHSILASRQYFEELKL